MKEVIETLKRLNPYPEEVFIEPTKEEYKIMREALEAKGLTSDKFFGSMGRRVWNNCVNTLKEIVEGEE